MSDGVSQVVGGVRIGPSPVAEGGEGGLVKRKRGKDGVGVVRKRRCKRCVAWEGGYEWRRCAGSGRRGRDACEFLDQEPPEEDEEEFEEGEGEFD